MRIILCLERILIILPVQLESPPHQIQRPERLILILYSSNQLRYIPFNYDSKCNIILVIFSLSVLSIRTNY